MKTCPEPGRRAVRCAIYTRKSSEEGLEQGFNSLDAQREACAAYILSQASEGWTALTDVYDDGGISGGTLQRPALQRLLADVAAGRVDIIVVYKVDRLTRSLLDFSKLVEAFDKAGVSFVSITQSFNTTTSMGRLTLNMLLSFAQFEREVTAERIRDKIAASKAKGMWMGGTPPLGYEPDGRSLRIVDDHAAIVRDIFARYLRLGNVRLVAEELRREGIRSPSRISLAGRQYGGRAFSRGQLYGILKCPTYIGEVHHHGAAHRGLHAAIVDADTWEYAQAKLADNRRGHRTRARATAPSLLAGKVSDSEGEPLVATHACKGRTRYRYYVSSALHHRHVETGMRIPALELERAVATTIASALGDPLKLAADAGVQIPAGSLLAVMTRCEQAAAQVTRRGAEFPDIVDRVVVSAGGISIFLQPGPLSALLEAEIGHPPPLEVTARLTRSGRVLRLVDDRAATVAAEPDQSLVRLIAKAQVWWTMLRTGAIDIQTLARREGVGSSWVTRVLRLAFLSPPLVDAALSGRLVAGVGSTTLLSVQAIEPLWCDQAKRLLPGIEPGEARLRGEVPFATRVSGPDDQNLRAMTVPTGYGQTSERTGTPCCS